MSSNVYLDEIETNLPRLLACFDSDSTSVSFGVGDRLFWAWGLKDFANATFQGAVHGLARLWVSGFWPYETSEKAFVMRLHNIAIATKKITRKDGSLEEAFPFEGSYCVTALVAFDLLCALELLDDLLSDEIQEEWLETIAPLISFLKKSDETHAIISNHLATAAAALLRWAHLKSDQGAFTKAELLLERIFINRSSEGWLKEYEGFDPGYQTLCLYYLADIYYHSKSEKIRNVLNEAIAVLSYFVHPDGSFGGEYGSRATKFYFPAGLLAMQNENADVSVLASELEESIRNKRVVTLSAIDMSNFIPMFNAYAWAAALWTESRNNEKLLPCKSEKQFEKIFLEAGLLVRRTKTSYTIINYFKGGVIFHFDEESALPLKDFGVVLRKRKRDIYFSNQTFNKQNRLEKTEEGYVISSQFFRMPKAVATPFKYILLRICSLTIFKNMFIRERVKSLLVYILITRKKNISLNNERTITFDKGIEIKDEIDISREFEVIHPKGSFVPFHMASKGYWQINDEVGHDTSV